MSVTTGHHHVRERCGDVRLGCLRSCSIVHTPTLQLFLLADKVFIRRYTGECTGGKEIRMYEGNRDNPGSAEERASRCSTACLAKKAPLSGSWSGFVAKGFIVRPTDGSCYCENSDSVTCPRDYKYGYERYDWGSSRDHASGP